MRSPATAAATAAGRPGAGRRRAAMRLAIRRREGTGSAALKASRARNASRSSISLLHLIGQGGMVVEIGPHRLAPRRARACRPHRPADRPLRWVARPSLHSPQDGATPVLHEFPQPRPRPAQARHDRAEGDPENLRSLLVGQVLDADQQQKRALLLGQGIEARQNIAQAGMASQDSSQEPERRSEPPRPPGFRAPYAVSNR